MYIYVYTHICNIDAFLKPKERNTPLKDYTGYNENSWFFDVTNIWYFFKGVVGNKDKACGIIWTLK